MTLVPLTRDALDDPHTSALLDEAVPDDGRRALVERLQHGGFDSSLNVPLAYETRIVLLVSLDELVTGGQFNAEFIDRYF